MNTNETIEMNDLEAANAEAIKGGPKKIFIGGLSVAGQDRDSDGDDEIVVGSGPGATQRHRGITIVAH